MAAVPILFNVAASWRSFVDARERAAPNEGLRPDFHA
jgi:hypothetical protein